MLKCDPGNLSSVLEVAERLYQVGNFTEGGKSCLPNQASDGLGVAAKHGNDSFNEKKSYPHPRSGGKCRP